MQLFLTVLNYVYTHTPICILGNYLVCTGTPGTSTMMVQLLNRRSGYPVTTIPKALTKET